MMIRKSGNLPFVSTENNILLFSDHEVLVVRKKAVFNTACFVMPIFSDEVGIFYFTRAYKLKGKAELCFSHLSAYSLCNISDQK